MTEGITCYEQDETLCEDGMCLRCGCRLRNDRLSAQQRESVVPIAPVRRYCIHYDARGEYEHPKGDFVHWSDYQALVQRLAAIEITSSDGGVEGHARYASQAHPALGCKDGRNGVPDTNAKPAAGIKPGPSEAIADVSVDELEAFIGSLKQDSMAVARALLASYRIERLGCLPSGRR